MLPSTLNCPHKLTYPCIKYCINIKRQREDNKKKNFKRKKKNLMIQLTFRSTSINSHCTNIDAAHFTRTSKTKRGKNKQKQPNNKSTESTSWTLNTKFKPLRYIHIRNNHLNKRREKKKIPQREWSGRRDLHYWEDDPCQRSFPPPLSLCLCVSRQSITGKRRDKPLEKGGKKLKSKSNILCCLRNGEFGVVNGKRSRFFFFFVFFGCVYWKGRNQTVGSGVSRAVIMVLVLIWNPTKKMPFSNFNF